MPFHKILYSIDGNLCELSDCYFCESCNKIITQDNVKMEVDAYFCPGCLENIPSSEAYSKNFVCTKCYDCPRCMATVTLKSENINESYESNENNKKTDFSTYSITCSYCKLSAVIEDNFVNEENNTNTESENFLELPFHLISTENKDPIQLKTSKYLLDIINKLHLNSNSKNNFAHQNSILSNITDNPDIKTKVSYIQSLEERIINIEKSLKTKNSWFGKEEIKVNCNIKEFSNDKSRNKNDLTFKQYINNPEIINSFYLSSRTNLSVYFFPFYFRRKKLYVQFSKRCGICQRLIIKPQLNPLAQPPFRVNLTANLFMPNFKLVSVERNISYNNSIFSISIKIRIENLMDKPVKIDLFSEKDQMELSELNKLNKNYHLSLIEPKSVRIDPKWTPIIEQQARQLQHTISEKRNRNKRFINVYINELENIQKESELELIGVASFQSPTGNDSTIQFKIYCRFI